MFQATRNFVRRHRTNIALGFGLAGAGYLAVQYVGSKLSDAKNRMVNDRIARENLQRRFEQNQEDCTFTVQALLPTASEHVLRELPVEKLTQELQQKKAARLASSASTTTTAAPSGDETPAPSVAASVRGAEDDTQSLQSFASESFSGAPEERPRKSKAQLWSEIKISSLTRSFTLLYTLSLLTLLTRVQLNLLGRKNYLSSVVSLAERDGEPTIRLETHDEDTPAGAGHGVDLDTNRQYLTFSWWLLHRGWRDVMARVDAAVKHVFGPLTPRDTVTLAQFRELVNTFRKLVEEPSNKDEALVAAAAGAGAGASASPPAAAADQPDADADADAASPPSMSWLRYLLPPRSEEHRVLSECSISTSTPSPSPSPSTSAPAPAPPTTHQTPSTELRKLLDETSDLIDSPMATRVLAHMADVGFGYLIDAKLAKLAFQPKATSPPAAAAAAAAAEEGGRGAPAQQQPEAPPLVDDAATAKFASVLAVVARQAHLIGNGAPNEYLEVMERNTELEGFSALVYSSNFEYVSQNGLGLAGGEKRAPADAAAA